MELRIASYESVRGRMLPGDIIAFSGKGHFSEVIKWATRSTVSHVGVVHTSKVLFEDTPQPGHIVDIMESTTMHVNPETGEGTAGVQRNRLSHHVKYYAGSIWWLPLSAAAREALDIKAFTDFLMHHDGKPYDIPQAVRSAMDRLDTHPLFGRASFNHEDFGAFYCSELVSAALKVGGVLANINASEVTPIDLCRFRLFESEYVQIKGERTAIPGYNTWDPRKFDA